MSSAEDDLIDVIEALAASAAALAIAALLGAGFVARAMRRKWAA